MNRNSELLIALVRYAIKGGQPPRIPSGVDWKAMAKLSHDQGVTAIMCDGISLAIQALEEAEEEQESSARAVIDEVRKAKLLFFNHIIGEERKFEKLTAALAGLAAFNRGNGIRTLLIKGPGLSLNYPIPMHRNSSDLDIYEFGEHEKADRLLEEKLGIKIDTTHEHHTTFKFMGVDVENHYDIINRYAHRDSAEADDHFKQLLSEDCGEIEIGGQKVLVPSAQFNSEFLLRHAAQHFAGERLMIRQILDWATLADRHFEEIDWKATEAFAEKHGMGRFLTILNSICIDYFGIEPEKFGDMAAAKFGDADAAVFRTASRQDGDLEARALDRGMAARVMDDVMEPEFSETKPKKDTIRILAFKWRRWRANIWKHRLVYDEKLPMMFLTLAWSHLRRPGSMTK